MKSPGDSIIQVNFNNNNNKNNNNNNDDDDDDPAPDGITRHHDLNDLIWRSLGCWNSSYRRTSSGLVRQDGKRPNGLTLMPWQGGLAWDVIVVSTLAQSYVDLTGLQLVCVWGGGSRNGS